MQTIKEMIEAAVRDCAAKGLTIEDAAKSLGYSYQGLYLLARRLGVKFHRPKTGPRPPSPRNQEILAAFETGETLAAIGARHGITRERVRQIANKYGLAGRKERRRQKHDEIADKIKAMIADGMYVKEIAEKLGTSARNIHDICRYRGIVLPKTPIGYHRMAEVLAAAEKVKSGQSIRSACNRDNALQAIVAHHCHANGIVFYSPRWGWSDGRKEPKPAGWRRSKSDVKPRPLMEPKPKKEVEAIAPIEIKPSIKETCVINYGKASASRIAAELGITRNVVIGHWFRAKQKGELRP